MIENLYVPFSRHPDQLSGNRRFSAKVETLVYFRNKQSVGPKPEIESLRGWPLIVCSRPFATYNVGS